MYLDIILLNLEKLSNIRNGKKLSFKCKGGCVETSKPTTHGNPTYIVDDVVHYCVANMPGGVPRTSTLALNNATLPFLVKLANKGYQKALSDDKNFLAGLNVHKGQVTYKAVADVFGHTFVEPGEAIKH